MYRRFCQSEVRRVTPVIPVPKALKVKKAKKETLVLPGLKEKPERQDRMQV